VKILLELHASSLLWHGWHGCWQCRKQCADFSSVKYLPSVVQFLWSRLASLSQKRFLPEGGLIRGQNRSVPAPPVQNPFFIKLLAINI